MSALQRKGLFLGSAFLFAVFILILLMKSETYFLIGSGALIFFTTAFMLSFIEIKYLLLLLIATLPLSCKIMLPQTDVQVIFPSEILEGLLCVIYFLRFFTGKQKFDYAFLMHPVTIAILAFVLFSGLSVLFSSMILISVKSMMVKIVYVVVFYFLFYEVIKENPVKGVSCFLYYGISLGAVIMYTLFNHSGYRFSKITSGIVALPFYADHTIYSACIVFVLPVFVMLSFNQRVFNTGFWKRSVYIFLSVLFITGILFALCRAAWVSLVAGMLLFLILYFKIKPVTVFISLCLFTAFTFIKSDSIIGTFKQNRYDSNARDAGLEEQTKSITNISNDQSNGERLNRWKCAIRMFNKRPWFGFGPGTYQFQYIPFQKKGEMTRISVTNPNNIRKGHGGSAHSEYLLVFAEGGIFAFISFIFILLFSFFIGMQNCYLSGNKTLVITGMAILIGLSTYLIHGFFNNFLDTDKAAFLFWSAISMITAIDILRKKKLLLSTPE